MDTKSFRMQYPRRMALSFDIYGLYTPILVLAAAAFLPHKEIQSLVPIVIGLLCIYAVFKSEFRSDKAVFHADRIEFRGYFSTRTILAKDIRAFRDAWLWYVLKTDRGTFYFARELSNRSMMIDWLRERGIST